MKQNETRYDTLVNSDFFGLVKMLEKSKYGSSQLSDSVNLHMKEGNLFGRMTDTYIGGMLNLTHYECETSDKFVELYEAYNDFEKGNGILLTFDNLVEARKVLNWKRLPYIKRVRTERDRAIFSNEKTGDELYVTVNESDNHYHERMENLVLKRIVEAERSTITLDAALFIKAIKKAVKTAKPRFLDECDKEEQSTIYVTFIGDEMRVNLLQLKGVETPLLLSSEVVDIVAANNFAEGSYTDIDVASCIHAFETKKMLRSLALFDDDVLIEYNTSKDKLHEMVSVIRSDNSYLCRSIFMPIIPEENKLNSVLNAVNKGEIYAE